MSATATACKRQPNALRLVWTHLGVQWLQQLARSLRSLTRTLAG